MYMLSGPNLTKHIFIQIHDFLGTFSGQNQVVFFLVQQVLVEGNTFKLEWENNFYLETHEKYLLTSLIGYFIYTIIFLHHITARLS